MQFPIPPQLKFRLFNTESRNLDEIRPEGGHPIRMYTCGPTIYDFAHIGNFRTYVAEDLLRRALKFFGYPLVQVMNLTDIDDKTIRGAIAKGISLKEFTEPYRVAFFEDLARLQIQKAEHYPAATDYIPEMIELIDQLMQKGCAYRSPSGSVYFSIRHFPSYGKLSHLRLEDLKINASGDNDADEYGKENISDFVLWKAYDPKRDGQIFWESKFGRGRPGWHIECSAMAMKLLGPSIDLHCGGVDNMFPHHENEIAQSECCSGRQFVRHWMHVEHLLVDHKKMSKSLGNFYTLRDILKKGYTGAHVRYLLLSNHYRVQLNFTMQSLDAAKASLQRIEDFILRLRGVQDTGSGSAMPLLQKAHERFCSALAEDMNLSSALSVLFELIRDVNGMIDEKKVSHSDAKTILHLLETWNAVLGVLPLKIDESVPEQLQELLERREDARKQRNFRLSDELRDEIHAQGYAIEDTPAGARLKKR